MKRKDFIKKMMFLFTASLSPSLFLNLSGEVRNKKLKNGGSYPFGIIKDNKLLNIKDVRHLKLDAVKKQNFELAAKLRQVERYMLRLKDIQDLQEIKPPVGKYINVREIMGINKYTQLYNNGMD